MSSRDGVVLLKRDGLVSRADGPGGCCNWKQEPRKTLNVDVSYLLLMVYKDTGFRAFTRFLFSLSLHQTTYTTKTTIFLFSFLSISLFPLYSFWVSGFSSLSKVHHEILTQRPFSQTINDLRLYHTLSLKKKTDLSPLLKAGPFRDTIASPSIPFYSKNLPLRTAGSSRPRLSLYTPTTRKSRMQPMPALGALGHTWTAMRAMEFISLITIIGLTSNFISEMVAADYAAPSALIGTLVVVS